MSLTTSIPRFLLPQRGLIWRARLPAPSTTSQAIRHASKKAAPKKSSKPSKPLVLEKPTKFNPPSHGSRLPREAPRYPGPRLSAEEEAAQKTRRYPSMMPPEGTFLHWFLTNKAIHMYIALSTLFSLAGIVFVTNFKRTSPFADMVPAWQDIFLHPINYTQRWFDILRLNSARMTAETDARRARKVDDVAKRAQFRKEHGLDKEEGFGGWKLKNDQELLDAVMPPEAVAQVGAGESAQESEAAEPAREKRKVKKWLGIW